MTLNIITNLGFILKVMGECNSNQLKHCQYKSTTATQNFFLNLNIYSPTLVCFYLELSLIIYKVEKTVVFYPME